MTPSLGLTLVEGLGGGAGLILAVVIAYVLLREPRIHVFLHDERKRRKDGDEP